MSHTRTLLWLGPLVALLVAVPVGYWLTRGGDACADRRPDTPGPGLVAFTGLGGLRGKPGEFVQMSTYRSVFVPEVATGCITQPTDAPFSQGNPDISPNGRRIVFSGGTMADGIN